MSLATLFGKLQEHEMELMKLNQHEENNLLRKSHQQKPRYNVRVTGKKGKQRINKIRKVS